MLPFVCLLSPLRCVGPAAVARSAVSSCCSFEMFACFQRVDPEVVKCSFWTSNLFPHVFICWRREVAQMKCIPSFAGSLRHTLLVLLRFIFYFFWKGKSHETTAVVNDWRGRKCGWRQLPLGTFLKTLSHLLLLRFPIEQTIQVGLLFAGMLHFFFKSLATFTRWKIHCQDSDGRHCT